MKGQFEDTDFERSLEKLNSDFMWRKNQKHELKKRIFTDIEKIESQGFQDKGKLNVKWAKSERSRRKMKKTVVIPLVASLFLMFSVGVGAATIPGINHLLSIVSPKIALLLQSIDVSSEDKGIKMNVIGAMNDDEMAVIYVTMQDLTGNRIDETLDIYDYSLTEGHMFNSQIVDYDETSKTATLRIQANGGESFNNKKIKFHINSFLSHKQIYEAVKVNTNLLEVKNNTPQTISLDLNNISGGGGKSFNELKEQGTIQVLKPGGNKLYLPEIDFMYISNMGFIDNRLHILTKWTGDDIDSHGNFYFVNSSGDKIHASNISFGIDKSGNIDYGNEYREYIFDANNNLSELRLLGDFVSNGNHTVGNWNTTFKIQSVGKEKSVTFSKDFGTWKAKRMTVSPLGVTLYGNGEFENSSKIVVSAKMNDGSVQTFDSMFSFSENEKVKVKFLSSLPLDISKVESIDIDGLEINFIDIWR
ncbi:DUF4179 domain-containing protein [Bacillus massilinigeriensis]|uniref:DUF4179 domain-containing protein n=1 Tax=Bacillus massilionigeriensis TaxID=1805475 RepID=UPI000A0449A7|nr:DUF4179 domain-containing protein [Bacillus massilionigeriensis]